MFQPYPISAYSLLSWLYLQLLDFTFIHIFTSNLVRQGIGCVLFFLSFSLISLR